ncbi:MAG: DUF5309 family protein [Candidatus Omnitrophota bacterium]
MSQRSVVQTSSNQSTEGRAVRSVAPVIHQLEPDKYPLTVIMTKAAGRLQQAGNKKVEWLEDELTPQFDTLGAALTNVATSMTVSDGTKFVKNMLVRVDKQEIVRVTDVSTNTLTITRAVGETAARAADNGSQLHIIGMSYEEGAALGTILATVKTNPYNYMDITRTPFGWTRSAENADVYGQGDKEYDRAKAIIEHARDLEKKFILSERSLTASGGVDSKEHRTMRGIHHWITTNVQAENGELTEAEFDEFVRKSFRYGSKKKLAILSGKIVNVINDFAKGRIQMKPMDAKYGLALKGYISAFGDLEMLYHPLLENNSLTDLTGLAGTGYIVDPSNVAVHHLPNSYMVHLMDRGTNGDDSKTEEILSECTISVALEKAHGKLTGVTE